MFDNYLYVFGNGGHAKEIIRGYDYVHYYAGIKYLLDGDKVPENTNDAIIGIGDVHIKEKIANTYPWLNYINISIDRRNIQGKERGIIIMYNCTLTVDYNLGNHVHINSGSIVCHDVNIGDYSFIGPGAVVCGNVNIGKKCYIGAGSTIRDKINICDNVIIGCGAVVVSSITVPGTYVGVPARLIKTK